MKGLAEPIESWIGDSANLIQESDRASRDIPLIEPIQSQTSVSDRVFDLMRGARLADNFGTTYISLPLRSRNVVTGGHRGEFRFEPSAPRNIRELHLTIHDVSVFIPLDSAPRH